RIQRMVAQARAAGVVSPPIKELAAIFRVSETTVRRDLDTLRSR
ncbi:MAG: DeoR family transcriptional regulator, partial [Acidimicrobiia bacterium]|nr:DeoR family transcriptional regulator [Acidimicrobiia bacterium]